MCHHMSSYCWVFDNNFIGEVFKTEAISPYSGRWVIWHIDEDFEPLSKWLKKYWTVPQDWPFRQFG